MNVAPQDRSHTTSPAGVRYTDATRTLSGWQCLIQDKISTSPSPTDRRAVVAPRGRVRSSHWAIFLLNNIAITNNSTFPKIKLHYSISYCNKTKSNNLLYKAAEIFVCLSVCLYPPLFFDTTVGPQPNLAHMFG